MFFSRVDLTDIIVLHYEFFYIIPTPDDPPELLRFTTVLTVLNGDLKPEHTLFIILILENK